MTTKITYRKFSPNMLKKIQREQEEKERAKRPPLNVNDPIIDLLKAVDRIVQIREDSFDNQTRIYAKNYQQSAEEAMPGSDFNLIQIAKIMAMSDYSDMDESIRYFIDNG